MGRGQSSNSKVVAFCLSALFATFLLPLVSASGGGAVIDVSTFSLQDFATTEQSSYDLEFTVIELLSSDADVEARIELSTLEGTVFDSMSQNFTLAADSSQVLQFNLTLIPFGYTQIGVELVGELGSPNSTQALTLNRTLHRLQPIEISLASPGQVLLNGLTPEGALTGNVSIHDGDYLQTETAVINNGDFSWSGHLTSSLFSNGVYDNQTSSLVTVAPLSSTVVQVNSTIAVYEGTSTLVLQLNDSGDGNTTDETRQITFEVAPPPLPLLSLALELLTPDVLAGDEIAWDLNISNTGSLNYSGLLVCSFGSQILFDTQIQVLLQSSIIESLFSTSRPDLLACSVSGMRVNDASITDISLAHDVESAAFESAGSSIPALLNGPWHKGDIAVFSMLIRNHGELPGTVQLVCETNGMAYTSNELMLDIDAAGEMTVEVPLAIEGQQEVNWSLSSSDGSIDAGLNGTILVPVAIQQTLTPKVTSVTWDAEIGIQFSWSLEMSEGIDRPVRFRLGYTDSGLDTYPLDYVVELAPGVSTGTLIIGFVDAERVSIRATPVNWTTGFGFSSYSLSVPDERPSYTLEFEPISVPNRPIPGESGAITVRVSNSGDADGRAGYIVVSTLDGAFLGQQSTLAIPSLSQEEYQFTFVWPNYQSVSLKATWVVSDESFDAINTFQSGEVIVEEASFSIPWVGIFGGLMAAVGIGAFIRIYQNRQIDSSKSKPVKDTSHLKSNGKARSENVEKIQVGCPECARQLRVPSDYGGQVRCPDCSNRFDVTPRTEPLREESEVEEESQEVESDGKVELHCPECDQSLRIPETYTGSVRCPACEEVFSAEQKSTD
jgi:uncharacterized CHY-type Zn-finger protein